MQGSSHVQSTLKASAKLLLSLSIYYKGIKHQVLCAKMLDLKDLMYVATKCSIGAGSLHIQLSHAHLKQAAA